MLHAHRMFTETPPGLFMAATSGSTRVTDKWEGLRSLAATRWLVRLLTDTEGLLTLLSRQLAWVNRKFSRNLSWWPWELPL